MARTDLSIPELGNNFVDYRDPIWGDSYNWAWNRKSTEIKYIVFHHSATDHDATPDYIANLHKNRGWGGIGYHFVITKDGVVYYVGDIGTARANVADMNEKVIGICLVGDFTRHLPSDEQITSAHLLCQFLINVASVPVSSWDQVVGHKELTATACPGSSWEKDKEGDMWWRIKNGKIYSGTGEGEQDDADTIKDLENKNKALLKRLESVSALVGILQGDLDTEEDETKRLSKEVFTARSERREAIREKKDLEGENKTLADKLLTRETTISSLREALKAAIVAKIGDISPWQFIKLKYFTKKEVK